jgi:hypothetical protein
MAKNAQELIPSAKRLISSLRDMGYDFAQAVADIVDNSVEAGATLINIDVEFQGNDSWLRIADNGRGMKPDVLIEAMRYGSERKYEQDDLGKFGLGLKTASMSQCQRLSVASRWSDKKKEINAFAWDLAHIERTNRWEILKFKKTEITPLISSPLKNNKGTVVVWQRLDRILGYKYPYGEMARKKLFQICREIELHLGMVFHKYLKGEVRGKRLKLILNGNLIQPWDPFCLGQQKTRKLNSISIPVDQEGISGEVLLEPFVLPHKDDFATPEEFQIASGPANWNQQQGFYIYRSGRLIQSGGWSNLRVIDEHTKLARIALSFSPALDEAFKINVAKMRVQLPSSIKDEVHKNIGPVVKLARDIYDKKESKVSAGKLLPVHRSTETAKSTSSNNPDRRYSDGKTTSELLTFKQWVQQVRSFAGNRELKVFNTVVQRYQNQKGAHTGSK